MTNDGRADEHPQDVEVPSTTGSTAPSVVDCEFVSPDGSDELADSMAVANEYPMVDDDSPRRYGHDSRASPPEEEGSRTDAESDSSQGRSRERTATRRAAPERGTLMLPSSVSRSFLPKRVAKAKARFDVRGPKLSSVLDAEELGRMSTVYGLLAIRSDIATAPREIQNAARFLFAAYETLGSDERFYHFLDLSRTRRRVAEERNGVIEFACETSGVMLKSREQRTSLRTDGLNPGPSPARRGEPARHGR